MGAKIWFLILSFNIKGSILSKNKSPNPLVSIKWYISSNRKSNASILMQVSIAIFTKSKFDFSFKLSFK